MDLFYVYIHCLNGIHIWSFSGKDKAQMQGNADQKTPTTNTFHVLVLATLFHCTSNCFFARERRCYIALAIF